jgi:hypothetical protein
MINENCCVMLITSNILVWSSELKIVVEEG